jgi:hypothetical protein
MEQDDRQRSGSRHACTFRGLAAILSCNSGCQLFPLFPALVSLHHKTQETSCQHQICLIDLIIALHHRQDCHSFEKTCDYTSSDTVKRTSSLFLPVHSGCRLTYSNVAGIIQGQLDTPLNDHGRYEASLVSKRLAGTGFTEIWSSSLSRAKEVSASFKAMVNELS